MEHLIRVGDKFVAHTPDSEALMHAATDIQDVAQRYGISITAVISNDNMSLTITRTEGDKSVEVHGLLSLAYIERDIANRTHTTHERIREMLERVDDAIDNDNDN